jgi:hypothetical protein
MNKTPKKQLGIKSKKTPAAPPLLALIRKKRINNNEKVWISKRVLCIYIMSENLLHKILSKQSECE